MNRQRSPAIAQRNETPTQPTIHTIVGARLRNGFWLPTSPAAITSKNMTQAIVRTSTATTAHAALAFRRSRNVGNAATARSDFRKIAATTKENATVAPAPHA